MNVMDENNEIGGTKFVAGKKGENPREKPIHAPIRPPLGLPD